MKKSDRISFRRDIDYGQLKKDLETAAQIADVPYDGDAIESVLDAYKDYFSHSPMLFRTSTRPKGQRRINVRFIEIEVPIDPFPTAFANGFITRDDHPIFDLHDDIVADTPVAGYGVDVAVPSGLQKIWLFLSELVPLGEVLEIPHFPGSFKAHADFLYKYGFNSVEVVAFDYSSKSINLYFIPQHYGALSPEKVTEMLGDLGLEIPSPEILGYCCRAVSIYPTFTWASDEVQRICFTVPAPMPDMMPTHLHPLLERYYANAPVQSDRRIFMFSPTPSRDGLYIKIENDYTGTTLMMMQQSMGD
jgi:hypothetical protein